MKHLLTSFFLIYFTSTIFAQNTWVVDQSGGGDFTEIQLAIDSLSVVDGDEVLVKDGTYFEHINFNQKEILLRSENGAATTIIDGGGIGDVVSIVNGEQAPTELRGFTITNGERGIYFLNGVTATLSDLRVTENHNNGGITAQELCEITIQNTGVFQNSSLVYGGGIMCLNSTLTLDTVTIVTNQGSTQGAGIYSMDSSVYMSATTIDYNYIDAEQDIGVRGVGIYCKRSVLRITDSSISHNEGLSPRYVQGAGIYAGSASNVIIEKSTITNNSGITNNGESYGAATAGGGCYVNSLGKLVTSQCDVSNNSLYRSSTHSAHGVSGGGVHSEGDTRLYDTTIVGNNIDAGNAHGAAAANRNGEMLLLNTFAQDNQVPLSGGTGTVSSDGGGLVIRYSTIINQTGASAVSGGVIRNSIIVGALTALSNCQITYSLVESGAPGIGNLLLSPDFTTGVNGDYYLSQLLSGQSSNSPCVNAGDPLSELIDGTTRTDGVTDVGVADMGYHYNGQNYIPGLPNAIDDFASTAINSDITIYALENDTAPNGNTLQIVSATQPSNGVVTFTAGSIHYTPNADWAGDDVFTYSISDSNNNTSTANITVSVGQPVLSATPLVSGGTVIFIISGSQPNATFILCGSLNGDGPTPFGNAGMSMSLSHPIYSFAPLSLDGSGNGVIGPKRMPSSISSGRSVWFQGVIVDVNGGTGVTLSNVLAEVVQ